MDNLSKLSILHQKRAEAIAGGGEDLKKKQQDAGKKTARERVALLFDQGTFVETDSFLKNRTPLSGKDIYADGVVAGYGTVDGRLVYCYSQDFTVLNGSLGEMNAKKIAKIYDLAIKTGAPVVAMLDCGGLRIEEGLDALASYNQVMKKACDLSGIVPQISVILGPCAGSLSFIPAVSDFVIMCEKTAQLYLTSKEVLKAETGEADDAFPGPGFYEHTNLCDFICASEEEAFSTLKTLLTYLPANYLEDILLNTVTDDINRSCDQLLSLIPEDVNASFDIREVIRSFADDYVFFETGADNGKNMVTGFVKLNGVPVGVVANQPLEMDGLLDNVGAKKGAAFIQLCDSFNIPILSVTDSQGFKASMAHEKWGMASDVAKLGFAFASATVAKVNLIVRKAYGAAYLYMNSKQMGADFVYAFPTAVITATTPEIAMNLLYQEEIAACDDPVLERAKIVEDYKNEVSSPYEAAKRGYIDDVIDPKDIRPILCSAFDVLLGKREQDPDKKHGNMPL